MPLIVVVEQEKRYLERIEQALSPQGWEIQGVADRAAAMQKASDTEVALLVVNSEVGEAAELVDSFRRGNGGPGAVLLVPESSKEDNSELGADEVLHKPFTDQDISLAVRRCVSAAQSGGPGASAAVAVVADDGVQLTSEDIFGDVVLELEDAFNLATAKEDAPVEESVAAEVTESDVDAVEEPESEEAAGEVEGEVDVALDSLEEVAEAEEEVSAVEAVEEEVAVDEEAEPEDEAADDKAEEVEEEETEEVEEEEVEEEPEVEEVEKEAELEEAEAAAPSKLDQALGSMRAKTVEIDEEFSRPAEVTDAEIDAMVRSVIVGPSKAAESTPQASSEAGEGAVEAAAVEEIPVESAEDYEQGGESDESAEAPEWRSSKKWIWIVLLLALAALLIFVISNAQAESKTQSDPTVVSEEAEPQPVEPVDNNRDDE